MPNGFATAWILVVERAKALIYESHGPGLPLKCVSELDNPRGRLREREVNSDRPGRAFDRVGGGRHAHSSEEDVADHDARTFVAQLIEQLEQGRSRHAFVRLVLVAPPKLLGMLRAAMPEALGAMVAATLPKDIAHRGADDIRERLSDVILV
jgi:protein required for attachment to host cells